MVSRLVLVLFLADPAASLSPTQENVPASPAGGVLAGDEPPRVLVSTDAGGSDPDDLQSLVHLFLYADQLELEGLVSSPPKQGRAADIHHVVDVYGRDFPRLQAVSARYPTPAHLHEMTVQGAEDPAPEAGWSHPTDGSRWIVQQARRDDPRPLFVLVWGSITDLAQAVHDAPDIKPKLRVFFIASWNRKMDPHAAAYLQREHPDLWMVWSDVTFRGWYSGGDQSGTYGNRSWVTAHARDHGALGEYFISLRPDDGGGERFEAGDIKMGDTPSLAWLLRGDRDDPGQTSWGGRYRRLADRPHWWTDLDPADGVDPRTTVSRWRRDYLDDFARRFDRCLERQAGETTQPASP